MQTERILVYKRTHPNDPDASGTFGIQDCMGQVRSYNFTVVIGVGGISGEPRSYGLSRRINWVGIKPTKTSGKALRGPLVHFAPENFRLFEERGPFLAALAPNLAHRVYGNGARFLFRSLSPLEYKDAMNVVDRVLFQGEFDHLVKTSSNAPSDPTECTKPNRPCRTLRKRCVPVKRRTCITRRICVDRQFNC